MQTPFVAYYRVSTEKQGRSGLGLEAQQAAVTSFLSGSKPISEFIEVESGRKAERPELQKALACCRLRRATLIIAKLDRLARNVSVISNLLDSGVEFVACDLPHANRLTIHILAAVAEHEAQMVSQRTKEALASARRRGARLGGFRGRELSDSDRQRALAVQKLRADTYARDIGAVIRRFREEGICTAAALATRLNEQGIGAPRGGSWQAAQVQRVLKRAAV